MITSIVTFTLGLGVLWCGLSLIRRRFVLSLLLLAGGCIIAGLGAMSVTMVSISMFRGDDALRAMALPTATFLGACLWRFGPHSPSDTALRRTLRSVVFAVVIALFVASSLRPSDAIVGVLPLLVFWPLLLKYRPASRWQMTIRKMAYSSMVLYAIVAFLGLHSAQALGTRGCFWVVELPRLYTLQLPHPYDYYAGEVMRYLVIFSFLLTVVTSVACLCIWLLDTLARKPVILSEAKNLR